MCWTTGSRTMVSRHCSFIMCTAITVVIQLCCFHSCTYERHSLDRLSGLSLFWVRWDLFHPVTGFPHKLQSASFLCLQQNVCGTVMPGSVCITTHHAFFHVFSLPSASLIMPEGCAWLKFTAIKFMALDNSLEYSKVDTNTFRKNREFDVVPPI